MSDSNDPLILIGNTFTILGWIPAALFVVFYGTRSKWRIHLVGRSLMYQSIALLLVLSVVLVGLWWPEMPGRVGFRLIAYGLLVFTMWRMFFTLVRYQREGGVLERMKKEAEEAKKPQRSSGSTDTTV